MDSIAGVCVCSYDFPIGAGAWCKCFGRTNLVLLPVFAPHQPPSAFSPHFTFLISCSESTGKRSGEGCSSTMPQAAALELLSAKRTYLPLVMIMTGVNLEGMPRLLLPKSGDGSRAPSLCSSGVRKLFQTKGCIAFGTNLLEAVVGRARHKWLEAKVGTAMDVTYFCIVGYFPATQKPKVSACTPTHTHTCLHLPSRKDFHLRRMWNRVSSEGCG